MDADIEELRNAADPSVAYRARRLLDGLPDDEPRQRELRRLIGRFARARSVLDRRLPDGTLRFGAEHHAYRKFQGPHWSLAALAELGYPPGDESLGPLVDQIHTWLTSPRHLHPPSTLVNPGHENRVRRCASQEGAALWYLHELGLADERTEVLAERLLACRWPDGGWNCDKRPQARCSSVQETLWPLRGLARHARARGGDGEIAAAVEGAAEFLLERRLLWRRRDGQPIVPTWGGDPRLIHWPIRFYDVLFVLVVMTELNRVDDPRCADAITLLAGKRLAAGGFPAELRTARTSPTVRSGGTFVDWGPVSRRRANPFVTVDAEWVLRRSAANALRP